MNDELRAIGSVRMRGILLLIAVAVAGGMAGGAIDRMLTARRSGELTGWSLRGESGEPASVTPRPEPSARREERRNPAEANSEIPYSLRSVDLTAEQRARIVEITRKYHPAAESLMRSVAPAVQRLNQRMNQEALCVLTPKQRDAWIAWRRREGVSMEEGGQMLALANANQCPK